MFSALCENRRGRRVSSSQNQLQGTISEVIKRESTVLCIVDVGFKLVVEITAESQKRMNIEIGSKVWCLFKSVAIDVAR